MDSEGTEGEQTDGAYRTFVCLSSNNVSSQHIQYMCVYHTRFAIREQKIIHATHFFVSFWNHSFLWWQTQQGCCCHFLSYKPLFSCFFELSFYAMVTISTIDNDSKNDTKTDKFNNLMNNMAKTKQAWDDDDGTDDEQDQLLSQAIDAAMAAGRGWGPGEKEAYLDKILDDDFIPPMFATTPEEMAKSGLTDAFTSLIYDGESPTSLMLQFRKKGNDAFANGKRNQASNVQWYRDAINHYYEALAWANKIQPLQAGDLAVADTDDQTYNETELDHERSIICANIALCHLQLKNWGHVRDEAQRAVTFEESNVKAWYRLAKGHQGLQHWEQAGDAIDKGLSFDAENKDLLKLQTLLAERVRKARQQRQQRERARAERVAKVKEVWKHAKESNIKLGRVNLVSTVTDDEEQEEGEQHDDSRWHQHLPNSGALPRKIHGEWHWPCMFLYPSHRQSDFIQEFAESDMLALRMADMFPELEDSPTGGTAMPWDYNNEFVCSKLFVYYEIHPTPATDAVVHPDSVELLRDQASCMRFYEAARALKGDEGPDMANVVRAVERKHLHQQRKKWKKKHGSLWAKPDPSPLVRLHPALSLKEILADARLVVPNFLVTFLVFPENHPAHAEYLKEHTCVGVLQPKGVGEG